MILIKIDQNNQEKKLYDFVQLFFTSKTKTAIKKMINAGDVKVNGLKVYDNYVLQLNDEITIYKKIDSVNQTFLKTTMTAKVFYEDENITIIDKNKGVVCHEDKNEKINSLNNFLKKRFFLAKKWDGLSKPFEPVLVNRIDRNTSGLLLSANNKAVLSIINNSQKANNITKIYLAVIHGTLKYKKRNCHAYIYQSDNNKMTVVDEPNEFSKPITTKIELLQTNNEFSLIKVEISNAKKHQIRAHLAHLGYQIVGDYKYANKKYFSPYKSQILISNEIIFNFESDNKLAYLNLEKFRIYDYEKIKLVDFIKKYEKIAK